MRAGIENKAAHVGYLPGAGDAIPESLREIGSEVKVLEDREVKADNLARFDAVIIGVRASNVHPARVSAWSPGAACLRKKGRRGDHAIHHHAWAETGTPAVSAQGFTRPRVG